jgi:SUKH-4 immunity protein
MIDNYEMMKIFGEEKLVCTRIENLSRSEIPDVTKQFISRTCFPRNLNLLRFFMDFSPLSSDPIIGELATSLGKCYTFGVRFSNVLLGILNLHSIGLPNNSSFAELYERHKILDEMELSSLDDSFFLESPRLCLDLENNGRIISVDARDFKVVFFNSSIQQFAKTLALFGDLSSGLSFKEEMQKVDPDAMASDENWWVIASTPELYREYNPDYE